MDEDLSQTNKTIVVKIGGSTLGAHDTTMEDLVTLQKRGQAVVVVHGGGALITDWLKRQGVASTFVRGRRVTDEASLQVVTAVLCGLVNKDLVAAINRLGGQAVGLSGVDGSLIEAIITDPELGLVGEVVRVNPEPLWSLLAAGYLPVLAPVGVHRQDGSARSGSLLNINADTVAGDLAAALGAEGLIFLTDVPGVLDGAGQSLPQLSAPQAQELLASGVASGGMIPKIEAALRARPGAKVTLIVDGREPHALLAAVEGQNVGTRIA